MWVQRGLKRSMRIIESRMLGSIARLLMCLFVLSWPRVPAACRVRSMAFKSRVFDVL